MAQSLLSTALPFTTGGVDVARELSRKPKQIRNRLRRGRNIDRDYRELVNAEGYKPLEEWDWAELAHGRPRNKNGKFSGKAPSWITPLVQAEARKRLQTKAFASVMSYAGVAAKVLVDLMRDPETDTRTRADIAKFIYEQLNGKATVAVDIQAKDSVRETLASALILDDGSPAHPVIDGQFHDEDEEPDDEDWPDAQPEPRMPQTDEYSPGDTIRPESRMPQPRHVGALPVEYRH